MNFEKTKELKDAIKAHPRRALLEVFIDQLLVDTDIAEGELVISIDNMQAWERGKRAPEKRLLMKELSIEQYQILLEVASKISTDLKIVLL